MNLTIAPREQFRRSPHGKRWPDAVTDPMIRFAAESALAQFVFEQPIAENTLHANDALRLQGARRYMAILLNLAEKEIERPIKMADNLPNET